jgi:hypothetical protein
MRCRGETSHEEALQNDDAEGRDHGIDLGDKVSRYCIVDQNGDVVEEGSFRNQALPSRNISAASRGESHWKRARNRRGSAAS